MSHFSSKDTLFQLKGTTSAITPPSTLHQIVDEIHCIQSLLQVLFSTT